MSVLLLISFFAFFLGVRKGKAVFFRALSFEPSGCVGSALVSTSDPSPRSPGITYNTRNSAETDQLRVSLVYKLQWIVGTKISDPLAVFLRFLSRLGLGASCFLIPFSSVVWHIHSALAVFLFLGHIPRFS